MRASIEADYHWKLKFVLKANNFTVIYPGDGQEYPPRGARGDKMDFQRKGGLSKEWL